jgi:hypothetical protein
MLPSIVAKMPWTDDFKIDHKTRTVELYDSSEGHNTSAVYDAVFSKVVTTIVDRDLFEVVHAQHSELFLVLSAQYPVKIEHFATPLSGIISRGAHLTAYTMTDEGMKIWVARRSPDVKTSPNKLDTTVAGGVRADESPFETIVHEADEEASSSTGLLRSDVRSCGSLTYMGVTGDLDIGENGLVVPDTGLRVRYITRSRDYT